MRAIHADFQRPCTSIVRSGAKARSCSTQGADTRARVPREGPPAPGLRVRDEHALAVRISLEQPRERALDDPADRRAGGRGALRERQGVDHVAHRGEADEEDLHDRLILATRSVVAWSFASPTIAVRPPYAATTPRSGTVSAE